MVPTWLEVALNGPWGKTRQSLIPVSVTEIIEQGIICAKEGAAILHVHAYDENTDKQKDDWQIYARIIEGIRSQCDALVYPTIPLAGSDFASAHMEVRFRHIHELAKRGLIEITVLDPGSVNFVRYDQMSDLQLGFIYMNPVADIAQGMDIASRYCLAPGYAIYEPGFTRLGAALAKQVKLATKPIYRFMFSNEFAWGFAPREAYLDAHLLQLSDCTEHAHWMVAGLGVDILPLVPAAVRRGGHVRVGLEDAPWGTQITNREWTKAAVQSIIAEGGSLASVAEIRNLLGVV
jgi:3-keto-5-aminohexanoate cleavage enzyme